MKELLKLATSTGSVMAAARLGAPVLGTSQPIRAPRPESFSRALVKLAEHAFVQAGETDKLGYFIFKNAACLQRWSDTAESLADIVAVSLGKQATERMPLGDLTDAEMAKAGGALAGIIGRGAALTPDVVKALLGGSLVVGGVGGGLTWATNRAIREDEDDIEGMKAKIQTYRRLTSDIENELSTRSAA